LTQGGRTSDRARERERERERETDSWAEEVGWRASIATFEHWGQRRRIRICSCGEHGFLYFSCDFSGIRRTRMWKMCTMMLCLKPGMYMYMFVSACVCVYCMYMNVYVYMYICICMRVPRESCVLHARTQHTRVHTLTQHTHAWSCLLHTLTQCTRCAHGHAHTLHARHTRTDIRIRGHARAHPNTHTQCCSHSCRQAVRSNLKSVGVPL
jgi:hypothetical protein